MLLYLLITCLSFFFFSKSLSFPQWASKTKNLLSFYFSKYLFTNSLHQITPDLASPVLGKMSILDLPDLPLDCILELLPPSELCTMARVCSSLRERCVSDHLWEKHLKTKWGKSLGPSAHKEWQCYLSSPYHLDSPHHKTSHLGLAKIISLMRSLSSIFRDDDHRRRYPSSIPLDSTMNFYLSLETGRFWFPAQVYNREVIIDFINIYSYSILFFMGLTKVVRAFLV